MIGQVADQAKYKAECICAVFLLLQDWFLSEEDSPFDLRAGSARYAVDSLAIHGASTNCS